MATVAASIKMFDMISVSAIDLATSIGNLTILVRNGIKLQASILVDVINVSQGNGGNPGFQESINGQQDRAINAGNNIQKTQEKPKWQSYEAPAVFNSTGAERMRQELNSLNSMMKSLQASQSGLNSTNIDLMSPNVIQDLKNASDRINNLQNSISKLNDKKRDFGNSMSSGGESKLNSSIEQLRESMGKALQAQKALNQAMSQGNVDEANKAYINMMQNIDSSQKHIRDNINSQESLNSSANKGNNIFGKVKGLIGNYLGFDQVKQLIGATIGGAMKLEQQMFSVKAAMGTNEGSGAYFDNLVKQANESAFSFEELAGSSKKFMQITKNTGSVDKLLNLNERLTLVGQEQDFDSAGSAIKGALKGDFSALQEDFGFGDADEKVLKASTGMDDFINKFNTILNQKGATQDLLTEYNQLPSAQLDNLKSNFESSMAQAGKGALDIMAPILSGLNQAFSNGSFQPFFNALSKGLGEAVNLVIWLGQVFKDNWAIIGPILIFTVGVLLGLMIQQLWLTIPPLLAQAAAWMVSIWPVLLIVGIVMLLISVLMQYGVTTEQILGFIGGLFGVLGATIYNYIAMVWNIFASLAEFVGNLFIDPVYAIKKLFYDLAMTILSTISNSARGLTNLVNLIPGVNVNLSKNIEDLISKLDKPTSDKNVFSVKRMEQIDYKEAATFGYNKGSSIAASFKDFNPLSTNALSNQALKNDDLGFWNEKKDSSDVAAGLKDSNDNLKNINDKMDVSNEHLEILRDLAEQESIQNFVSLTPSVQITTGDIKEEADINKIISNIENYMKNELVASAEGVYA
jgi:uncharacterized protein YdbL (DUF1318 family)